MLIQKTPPRKFDTSLPVSSILKDSRPEGDRATHTLIGDAAEARVAELLGRIYGPRLVQHKSGMATGTKGSPDVLLLRDPPVLVEVKTCTLFHRRRIFGAAKTFVHSWQRITKYAEAHLMNRVMIIEYRHKGAYIYVWITGENVDKMMQERLAKSENGLGVFHFDFKQACQYGQLLTDEGFENPPVESPQQRLNFGN